MYWRPGRGQCFEVQHCLMQRAKVHSFWVARFLAGLSTAYSGCLLSASGMAGQHGGSHLEHEAGILPYVKGSLREV